ncbi:glycosyltransferase family 39 protein [Streptomyces polygonati]|uniref:Glycosyltransferase family 39 protein n=1 Tax=Streptomyces polygonati TaxID=1617087 RepID=A0ABV8HSB1_9ACTN
MTAPSDTPPPRYAPAGVVRTPVPGAAPPPGAPRPSRHASRDTSRYPSPRASLARLRRGRPEDPAWARPALLALLLGTLVLYLYDLGASGYANSFYSAAVQAGSESWKAFFFGSSDAGNAITVDKPPAALWPMALSVRMFGLGSWQILVPEALMGVAAVGVLHAAVRRTFGAGAGLLAGAVLALTPVAALMFRFNNPDALLALLMVTAVSCVLRALEDARTKWLLWAGAVFGLAFLTKTLQAWLILPPLALVYGVCAPTSLGRRLRQLLYGGGAMLLAGGWWVAIVQLWPKSSRPYIGGSQDNSFLGLTFGYNGFGRITGDESGSVGGGAPGSGGRWGTTGVGRLFGSDMGGQIAWLLPAAFLFLLAGLWITRRARRDDPGRAAFLVWGGALLITFATFSFMSGIFHQYYNIALAPYIAALVGMGAALLWRGRTRIAAAATLAAAVLGTAVWAWVLLDRSPGWHPWVRVAVVAAGVVAAAGLLVAAVPGLTPAGRAGTRFGARTGARVGAVAAVVGLGAALGGPLAYTLDTVTTPHAGSIVTAGPAVQAGFGGPGGPGGGGGRMFGGRGGAPAGGFPGGRGQGPGQGTGGFGGFGGPGGTAGGTGGSSPRFVRPGQGGGAPGGGGGGMSGLLNGTAVSPAMKSLLSADAGRYTWVAAAIGSQNQASYQLATGKPVMSIGGFNGSDPSPTLAQFQGYVSAGRIHYFLGGGTGRGAGGGAAGGTGGSDTAAQITSWVEAHFTAKTVGTTTVYDLTAPASSPSTTSGTATATAS